MNEEHDEALVARVALAIAQEAKPYLTADWDNYTKYKATCMAKARAVIYPPAPPKTRLQVARELLAAGFDSVTTKESILNGYSDSGASIEAILAALALPAMED